MSGPCSEAQLLMGTDITCHIGCDVLTNLNYHEITEVRIIYKIQKERRQSQKNLLKTVCLQVKNLN